VVGYEDVQATELSYCGCNQSLSGMGSREITLHRNTIVLATIGG